MASVYEIVTNTLVKELEKGVIPWRRPWAERLTQPVNWKSQKPYRGINQFLLPPGEYLTFRQVQEAKGRVRKGETGHIVVFWKLYEKEDEEGKAVQVPVLRYYRVWEISQCEGIESKLSAPLYPHNPIEAAERILRSYKDSPEVSHQPGRACYYPGSDRVIVPPMGHFEIQERYYATLFHELVHSTGHKSRLARKEVVSATRFGDESYSREELVAELGAAMLCAVAGIEQKTIENQAAYIAGWLAALKNDKRLLVTAAAQAQKAADYIQNISMKDEEEQAAEPVPTR